MPSQRFSVEFDRRTVGIAVRVAGGFMFFSSDPRFDAVDGRMFPRARGIERALRKAARVPGHSRRAAQPGFATA